MQNGQTVVISGILRDEESEVTRGIPLLSDIPLIGELFKSRENSTTTSELVAFITPYVVDRPSENESNFQQQYRDRLQELARPIKEQAKERRRDPQKYRDEIIGDRLNPPQSDETPPIDIEDLMENE